MSIVILELRRRHAAPFPRAAIFQFILREHHCDAFSCRAEIARVVLCVHSTLTMQCASLSDVNNKCRLARTVISRICLRRGWLCASAGSSGGW